MPLNYINNSKIVIHKSVCLFFLSVLVTSPHFEAADACALIFSFLTASPVEEEEKSEEEKLAAVCSVTT